MVYFSNGQITIRNMEYEDAQAITDAEIEQGWDASIEKYQKSLEDQRLGKAIRKSLILAFWKNIENRVLAQS